MALVLCQKDSYRRTYDDAVVLSCTLRTNDTKENASEIKKKKKKKKSKTKKTSSYLVELDATILFPEGGGQPCDYGTLVVGTKKIEVRDVYRDPTTQKVMHVTSEPLNAGDKVSQTVDWERRFDFMQQHTAQHLISAVAMKTYQWKTLSWNLGADDVVIEFDAPKTQVEAHADALEAAVNRAVREGRRVSAREMTIEEMMRDASLRASSKKFPDGLERLRIVEIEGIDKNPCCGTHLRSLADMQCVKFFAVRGCKATTSALHFRAGNRVLRALQASIMRDNALNDLLHCGSASYVDRVARILKDQTQHLRTLKRLKADVASSLATQAIQDAKTNGGLACVHREGADLEMLRTVASIWCNATDDVDDDSSTTPRVLLLTTTPGPDARDGMFMLAGSPDDVVSAVGKLAAKAFEGRGGGKKGRFQGKGTAIHGRSREHAASAIRAFLSERA